ncbi:serine hydrolase domain-containing protein [Aquihabitans sp. McL0605]|uniref:serine hydrolase domain-containing protein n=1 Tax=Aquihabitans sp. McL0605 TaxID=3415671 RepID=UPI003CF9B5E9
MKPPPDRPVIALPEAPAGVAWPTEAWERQTPTEAGADEARVEQLVDALLASELDDTLGLTGAVAVVAGGRLVLERYGRRVVEDLAALDGDIRTEAVAPGDTLRSWSMAKSITSLAVGVAVADGAVDIARPVGDPQWMSAADDPRAVITWDHLLTMRPGLQWTEEYYDLGGPELPDVVTMLWGEPSADMAAFAAGFPLVAEPGTPEAFTYSSGTTNVIAANLQRTLGLDRDGMDRFLHDRIFDPIGMRSAIARYDDAGTFIGSSYVFATLQDWCRFGLLALRGGAWDGARIVPDGWIDWSRAPRSWDDDVIHGAQWWSWDLDETPFGAHGFEGQRIIAFPARDVIVVRLGKSGATGATPLNHHLAEIAACFPRV